MFNLLSNKLTAAIRSISGRSRITEENIKDVLREIRVALLEADVAFPVIKSVLEKISEKALGQEVISSLRPGEVFVKIVHDELIKIIGEKTEGLNFRVEPPAVILMAGLQGSGKTTTVAKLAKFIKETLKKSVLVVSADVYRPAAIKQLESLATQVNVDYFPSDQSQNPVEIAKNAVTEARKKYLDVVIVDTAGRLHIDQEMMSEIKDIHRAVNPIETLFVVDSMTGQDAVNTAKAFNDAIPITGVVLTKTDGDARGGAALSVKVITGKPIKFVGVGEKIDDLEPFHPDRVVSKILGMGDILSLVEEAERKIDKDKAEKLAKKLVRGVGFNFEDFRDQLLQVQSMGGFSSLMSKLPNLGVPNMNKMVDEKVIDSILAVINSMTAKERIFPDLIKNSRSRKLRIASGSGRKIEDVNNLLKQFEKMQKVMKLMGGGKMLGLMKKFM